MSEFWKITNSGADTAELELNGEICSERPRDFWTDEKQEGSYIALDEFKAELAKIKNAKNLTIKLNTLGGDLFAGKAIYDELQEIKAKKTILIMGAVMSAGTVVMLAGKVKAHKGDIVMIHEAKTESWQYFDSESAKRLSDALAGCNRAIAELYAQKTGKGTQEILNAMHAEKWFTADEAKDYGLVDEVIDDVTAPLAVSADGKTLFSNNHAIKIVAGIPSRFMQMLPVHTESTAPAKGVENKLIEGGDKMEEITTVENLEKTYPDLVNAIRADAEKSAKELERKRIQEIEAIQNALVLDKETIANAKYGDGSMNARDLAFSNAQAQAKIGAEELEKIKADAKASNADKIGASGNTGADDTKKKSQAQAQFDVVCSALDKEFN